ncbi:CopG family ribbon-helix-helix protein [Pseudalkalibacillus decolorationis]|uniref:CopG family ribbon-helix-helix protein n=1 Tax=Pseudalkalibacillus decolorationis TaxID=163879 RepID=UPI0021475529|nr:CopG family ribbon-helix-helix protein [Pseudalkalibacillus decolorationis]
MFVSDMNTKRIVISLPEQLIEEVDGAIMNENLNRSEFIHQATKMYLRERQSRHIRETMRQGYMEMAKINLNIASEAFLAEEEADLTLDRLVSGV